MLCRHQNLRLDPRSARKRPDESCVHVTPVLGIGSSRWRQRQRILGAGWPPAQEKTVSSGFCGRAYLKKIRVRAIDV